MKTETIQQAIDFVLGIPKVKEYIMEMEKPPHDFAIFQISGSVLDYSDSIVRIIINFNERNNPNNFKEDAVIDVQGTNFQDFRILRSGASQIRPLK